MFMIGEGDIYRLCGEWIEEVKVEKQSSVERLVEIVELNKGEQGDIHFKDGIKGAFYWIN